MESGAQGDDINHWGLDMFETVQGTSPTTSNEETAFAKWLDQTSERDRPGWTGCTARRGSSPGRCGPP